MSVSNFQGVLCSSLDAQRSVNETIIKLLKLHDRSNHFGIDCYDLHLNNKYYQTTVHLLDSKDLIEDHRSRILEACQAIILYGDGQTITTENLDSKNEQFSEVKGEPRVLLFDKIDEECPAYKTLLDWCISKGYDFIDASDETAGSQLVDSLSAYKWTQRSEPVQQSSGTNKSEELNEDLMKKLVDFDSLLGKLSAYRERPELRGNPDDKNILEIAEILSNLLSDDVDNFLDSEEGKAAISKTATMNQASEQGTTNGKDPGDD